jgi:hypothetical protein
LPVIIDLDQTGGSYRAGTDGYSWWRLARARSEATVRCVAAGKCLSIRISSPHNASPRKAHESIESALAARHISIPDSTITNTLGKYLWIASDDCSTDMEILRSAQRMTAFHPQQR